MSFLNLHTNHSLKIFKITTTITDEITVPWFVIPAKNFIVIYLITTVICPFQ